MADNNNKPKILLTGHKVGEDERKRLSMLGDAIIMLFDRK